MNKCVMVVEDPKENGKPGKLCGKEAPYIFNSNSFCEDCLSQSMWPARDPERFDKSPRRTS